MFVSDGVGRKGSLVPENACSAYRLRDILAAALYFSTEQIYNSSTRDCVKYARSIFESHSQVKEYIWSKRETLLMHYGQKMHSNFLV